LSTSGTQIDQTELDSFATFPIIAINRVHDVDRGRYLGQALAHPKTDRVPGGITVRELDLQVSWFATADDAPFNDSKIITTKKRSSIVLTARLKAR
jgi:hypothetical protein